MKSCPVCRRSYEDDSLAFCLDDGTRLVARQDQQDPNATWHLPHAPSPSDVAPTVMPQRPTVPSPQATITARPDQYQYHPAGNNEPSHHKRNPLPWVLAIVLVLGASGVLIAWIMTRDGVKETRTSVATPTPRDDTATLASTPDVMRTPQPSATQAIPKDSPKVEKPKATPTAERANPTPTPERAKPAFSMLNNITYSGGSRITYYPRASVGGCQADCAANPSCRVFTWIRPGAYNPGDSAMCYLMYSVSGPVSHPCCISGVKN